MNRPQRSSNISLMDERCPKALDYLEEGVPYPRDHFRVGSVTHDILWAIGNADGDMSVIPVVCHELMTKGRGGIDAEPPYPEGVVNEAKRIAKAYAADRSWPKTERWYELGIGVKNDLKTLVPYEDESAYFRSRGDMAERVWDGDDEGGAFLLEKVDYKTAWPTNESELDTIQRVGQAICARAFVESGAVEPVEGIKVTVVNLRTHGRFSRTLWFSDTELWESMEKRLHAAIAAANHKPRVKSPGACCIGCPFLAVCEPELPELVGAQRYTMLEAYLTSAKIALKAELKESDDEIPVTDGFVGYHKHTTYVPTGDAHERLWRALVAGKVDMSGAASQYALGAIRSVLTSATAVKRLATHIHGRGQVQERRALIDECLVEKPVNQFGVRKVKKESR